MRVLYLSFLEVGEKLSERPEGDLFIIRKFNGDVDEVFIGGNYD